MQMVPTNVNNSLVPTSTAPFQTTQVATTRLPTQECTRRSPMEKLLTWHKIQITERKKNEIKAIPKTTMVIKKRADRCVPGKTGRSYLNGKCSICGGKANFKCYVDKEDNRVWFYDRCI